MDSLTCLFLTIIYFDLAQLVQFHHVQQPYIVYCTHLQVYKPRYLYERYHQSMKMCMAFRPTSMYS